MPARTAKAKAAKNARRRWRYANDPIYRAKQNARNRLNKKRRSKDQLRRKRLRKKYGITPEFWDAMFAAQGGRCAICLGHDPGVNGWHTDHCHATGRVRGILCKSCNTALGFVGEGFVMEWGRRAAAYLTVFRD